MEDIIVCDGIFQEEFECADCDFKGATESEIKDHSVIHIKTEYDDTEERDICLRKRLKTVHRIENENDENIIKQEHAVDECDFLDQDQREIKYGDMKLKLEHIDIDQNIDASLSSDDEISESDPLVLDKHSDNEQKSRLVKMIKENKSEYFEVKRILFECQKYDLICCKICQYSTIKNDGSYNHAMMHIKRSWVTPRCKNSDIYDSFICSSCNFKSSSSNGRYDLQIHMQIHKDEKFTNIIGVKLVDISGESKLFEKLFFCESCDFACKVYDNMVLHLIVHSHEEVVAVGEVKCNQDTDSETESESSEESEEDDDDDDESSLHNSRRDKLVVSEDMYHKNIKSGTDGYSSEATKKDSLGPPGFQSQFKSYLSNDANTNTSGTGSSLETTLHNNVKKRAKGYRKKLVVHSKPKHHRNISSGSEAEWYLSNALMKGTLEKTLGIIRNNISKTKVEIEVDNTGKYIPAGWERKVYKISKADQEIKYKVAYISPYGNDLFSNPQQVTKLIDYLNLNGIKLSVNVNEMDFSHLQIDIPKEIKS